MKKKIVNKKKKSVIIKLAEIIGEESIGRCGIWFNQPKVPDKMKKD